MADDGSDEQRTAWNPDPRFPSDPEFYRRVLDHMPSPIVVVDAAGAVRYENQAMVDLVGWTADEGVGTSILGYIHPDDAAWVTNAFLDITTSPDSIEPTPSTSWTSIKVRVVDKDGEPVPVEVTGVGAVGDPAISGVIYDVRPARRQQHLAQVLTGVASGESTGQLLSIVLETLAAPPLQIDAAVLEPDGAGKHRVVAATTESFSSALDELSDPAPWGPVTPELAMVEVASLPAEIAEPLLELGQVDLWHTAVESAGAATPYIIVACTPVHQVPAVGVIERVTRARELAGVILLRARGDALLAHAATHDQLTNMYNRIGFKQHMSTAEPATDEATVMFFDLDGFKSVNDQHGHDAGDTVLRVVAERIKNELRPGDVTARIGGDEFIVVLNPAKDHEASIGRAESIADRLLATIGRPIEFEETSVRVAASIGIAIGPASTELDTLIAAADDAMFTAKRRGGGSHHLAMLTD